MNKETIIEKIKQTAKIIDIAETITELKTRGVSRVCTCPKCGTKDKLSITPNKDIAKCFVCDIGAKGAVNFLTKFYDKEYLEAIKYCAEHYNIELEYESKNSISNGISFRDTQLKESGIPLSEITLTLADGTLIERYESGSIGRAWKVKSGDNMFLNYVDLDGSLTTYINPRTRKAVPFKRVRYKNPEDNQNEAKYMQPKKSGSHLWLPNTILNAYKEQIEIDTLIITEGEKKADKLCCHGLFAIGIMGIHNLSIEDKMSEQFRDIIQTCKVRKVIFLLDADWQDLSIKERQPVNNRPYSFFKSVKKFRDYFYHYNNDGLHLNIYLSYIKENELNDKGADDLLSNTLKNKENLFKQDIDKAIIDREGKGDYVNCHDITSANDYQLKEFWHLHDVKDFGKKHLKLLKPLEKFKYGRCFYKFDENDTVVFAQPLKPNEQYWKVKELEDNYGNITKKYSFHYQNIRTFLKNRNFGKYIIDMERSIFVHCENRIVKEATHNYIADFVVNYTEEIKEEEVLHLLLRGGSQYLGQEKLNRMYPLHFDFIKPQSDSQHYFFKDSIWKITADTMIEKKFSELHGHIWDREIINANPNLFAKPLFQIEKQNETFNIISNDKIGKCHLWEFLMRTSFFNWEKGHQLINEGNGSKKWIQKDNFKDIYKEERSNIHQHLVSKIIAIGYLAHTYQDVSDARAIICMDGKESIVGESNGGTGKSIFSQILKHILPTVRIDGKTFKMDDSFLYQEVDDYTKVIVFDDCRKNIDFEAFFGQITSSITVNIKSGRRFSRPAPKFILTTNHAVKGEGNSFERRQYATLFSDWYNEYRSPKDDFGCTLFNDWDKEQWNLFYNFIACCVQTYLNFGFTHKIPAKKVEKIKLRQDIGEGFLDWANLYFGNPANLNKNIIKKDLEKDFKENYPKASKHISVTAFKKKLKKYCLYRGFLFNPNASKGLGKDLKPSGIEHIHIGTDEG